LSFDPRGADDAVRIKDNKLRKPSVTRSNRTRRKTRRKTRRT